MNFSSIQAYLEPSNWQQQQNGQSMGNSGANGLFQQQQPQTVLPPLQPVQPNGGGGVGSIRPGSMTEKARLANIPMPETSLKCPRCQSTNTKFCYFNNYNLTQPRHFCKTCRRYWTKGGALRSVPVGGGCRRNKRSKSTAAKSSPKREIQTTHTATSTVVTGTNSLGLTQQLPPLHFMPPLMSQLTSSFNAATDMGMGYRGVLAPNMTGPNDMNFEQWRSMQQFPFFDGSENHELSRPRQLLGSSGNNERSNVTVNNAWPDDLSTFSTNNINRNL